MSFIASNNGLTVQWFDPDPTPIPTGSVAFAAFPTPAQLTAAFSGYAPAIAVQQAQQAMQASLSAAMAGGCAIVSTGTPSLNGTYPTDPGTIANMTDEVLSIATDGTFIGGGASIAWPVVGGTVTLTVAQFTAIRKAVSGWVAAWDQYASGASSTKPTLPVTIA